MYKCDAKDYCWDEDVRDCPIRAANGECRSNADYMRENCLKSCGSLCISPDCKDLPSEGQCSFNAERLGCEFGSMMLNCRKTCGLCGSPDCKDLLRESECSARADRSGCNWSYMRTNCRKTCGFC